ncbi:MAG: CpaF family protein [Moorellales bacterium]
MSLLARLEQNKGLNPAARPQERASLGARDPLVKLKNAIHKRIIDELRDAPLEEEAAEGTNLAARIEKRVLEILAEMQEPIPKAERLRLAREIVEDAAAFGPITPLLDDPEVTEIMVNGPERVYVERHGRIERTEIRFRDNAHVMHILEKIVAPLGRRIDESMPMVDARLPDGSRVNAVIPPIALVGPTVTIRKFYRDRLTAEDLVRLGTLTPEMMRLLEACVKGRLNIIVSGGTGSGKTTLLNVLSSFIPPEERIITIEDAAELQLQQEHVITLESRPPNVEGRGAVTIRDLVRNALRMRPDRIVVGEVRSGEALDMLQAMNTGHDGSLTTAHANSPRDLLSRLETMVLMAGMELPVRAIREQIASAIDLIIHQSRFKDGSRKVTHITEVQGMEGDTITLQDLFVYRPEGYDPAGRVKGRFTATGIRPKFLEKLAAYGLTLPPEIFFPSSR